ncbi:tyrosine-protein kinase Srms [Eublepharis macularius]|uniref:Tyrosine-protein kinase n=1 Tax=Eublepharis macularius TaxID=481883 RepID=A0AA97JG80_EUBMA|nr:tyrosine-protein kinase Srms [Eublepharis macularius]
MRKLQGEMDHFLRKHFAFLASFWNKFLPNGVPNNHSLDFLEQDLGSLNPTLDPKDPGPSSSLFGVLYDFTARNADELSVNRGDKLCVLKEEGEYVLARRLSGDPVVGYVPANYVSKIGQEPVAQPVWYISGISRNKAQILLLSSPNRHGSFLIRDSESNKGEYSLSVRNHAKVRHFRIYKDPGGSLYLEKEHMFSNLEQLLAYYTVNWKVIQSPLLQPCIQKRSSEADQWERPRSEFKLWRKMGEGCFGEVWEGMWKNTVPVAIKIMKQVNMRDDFAKEIQNLKSLKHTRLIKLLAICSVGEPVYIVTELMRKGNLHSYLNSIAGKELTKHHLLSISCQVADGMTYLEEQHVVHRDLAARNILVGDDLACKIADFGLARLLKDDIYSTSGNAMIPVKWTAPEAAVYQTYSLKSDVWSYGILLYEVFTYGQNPYEGMTNQETIQQITRGYRLPRPNNCYPEIYSIMLDCWKANPEDRPTFLILREQLFSIYKWAPHPFS